MRVSLLALSFVAVATTNARTVEALYPPGGATATTSPLLDRKNPSSSSCAGQRILLGSSENSIQQDNFPTHQAVAQLSRDDSLTSTADSTSIKASSTDSSKRKDSMIAGLGVLSGFAGVLCFRRFGCYSNMMTGNVARLAHAVAAGSWTDAAFFASLLLCYASGTFLFRVLDILTTQQHEQQMLDSNKTLPRRMIPLLVFFFVTADVIDLCTPLPERCMMPFLSVGFAMINSYSQSTVGSITNAATGHLTRLGMGLADAWLLQTPFSTKRPSRWFLQGFALSILVTSALYSFFSTHYAYWRMPMGSTMGLLYMVLLSWYNNQNLWSRTTQFQQQFFFDTQKRD